MNGISVGITEDGHSVTWYRAHGVNRCKDGSMAIYALDDARTIVKIPARKFAGVGAYVIREHCKQGPCILTYKVRA